MVGNGKYTKCTLQGLAECLSLQLWQSCIHDDHDDNDDYDDPVDHDNHDDHE